MCAAFEMLVWIVLVLEALATTLFGALDKRRQVWLATRCCVGWQQLVWHSVSGGLDTILYC